MLPQFTFIEILASIGGVLFMGYLFGSMIFPLFARFYLENHIMSKLYGNVLEPKQAEIPKKAPWGSAVVP